MLFRVPEVCRRPAGVSGDGNHLEVAAYHVAFREGSGDFQPLRDRPALILVAQERRAVSPGVLVAGERSLVAVVQVAARDAAHAFDLAGVSRKRAGAVDEQVAGIAPQEKRADLERRGERQGLGWRGVEARYHFFHRGTS